MAKDKFTVFELSDLDTLYGDSSVCARLFAQVDDGILSLTDFLLLRVSMLDRRGRHGRWERRKNLST